MRNGVQKQNQLNNEITQWHRVEQAKGEEREREKNNARNKYERDYNIMHVIFCWIRTIAPAHDIIEKQCQDQIGSQRICQDDWRWGESESELGL